MQNAKILSKTMLTDEILELKLETTKIDTLPGQWMFINYLGLEKPLKRAYSIANSETQGEVSILTFLIKLLENGQGSNQLKSLQIGDEVGLEGPNGHFTLKNTPNPKVFQQVLDLLLATVWQKKTKAEQKSDFSFLFPMEKISFTQNKSKL